MVHSNFDAYGESDEKMIGIIVSDGSGERWK